MRFILLPLILLVVEIVAFQLLRSLFKRRRQFWGYIAAMVLFYAAFFMVYIFHDRQLGQTTATLWANGFLLLNAISKLMLVIVASAEDIIRIPVMLVNKFRKPSQPMQMPSRRKFVQQIGLGLMAVPFIGILDGVLFGRFRFRVLKHTLYFPDLPSEFDGYRVMQISDLHLGSINEPGHLEEALHLLNTTEADILVMTGDLVNTLATEVTPHLPWLNKIRQFTDGKWAILGNHDYGEYVPWPSEEEKNANFEAIKQAYKNSQLTLLNNAKHTVQRGDAQLHLVGVENWGRNFIQKGDLDRATGQLQADDFKILLSHDPSHWEEIVRNDARHYQLTLSGHTHGMQFGIEIPGMKWSPIQWYYAHWAGLYRENERYLYVNRGFGYHAYPGRVGIWPEITVFELKKGPNASS